MSSDNTKTPSTSTTQPKLLFSPNTLQTFTESILTANGVPSENVKIIASALIQADLRGVDTHGVNRIPSYMERIRQGVLDAKAEVVVKKITPVVVQIDGKNGFGFLAAERGSMFFSSLIVMHFNSLGLIYLRFLFPYLAICMLNESSKTRREDVLT
jgi:hypothetical protein